MNKHLPSFYNKVKAVVLLLCLFFMMVDTCPVRTILSSASFSIVETSKQPNNTKAFVNKDLLSCSFEGEISQATLLDFSKTSSNSLPLPFIIALLNLYLFISILNTWKGSITEYRNQSFVHNIPLFLKNRSIII